MGFSHYTSQLTRARPEIVDMKKDVEVYSASGVYGDASLATVEKGRNVVEDRIRYIVDELRGFILE